MRVYTNIQNTSSIFPVLKIKKPVKTSLNGLFVIEKLLSI